MQTWTLICDGAVPLQIRPYKHVLFSKCDTCVAFAQIRSLLGEDQVEARRELQRKQQRHLEYVGMARERMRCRAEYARNNKDAVLMINVDGMDQNKTNVPHESLMDKGSSCGMPLQVKLMGAIAYARGWYGFWSVPQWAASSNITLTAITKIIRDAQADGQRRGLPSPYLPPRLILQMDNTSKDNKNHYLIGYAGMLLSEGLFQEVEAHFLPVGHTHQEIDQSFSLVSKAIKQHGALTVDDLMRVASGAWKNLEYVGASGKTNLLLETVHDYRRALRYQGRRADDELDPDEERRNMHRFAGLGTERRKDEEVSKRRVATVDPILA